MKSLLIWGAGDQGLVTLDCALSMNQYGRIDFLEIKERGSRLMEGCRLYREEDIEPECFFHSYDEVIVATGDNDIREAKCAVLESMGVSLASVIHPLAFISPSANLEKGCMVFAYAVIHTHASVGKSCIINTGAVVEHDCMVGDFVNVCPNAAVAGHCRIGRKSFIGVGASVKDEVAIGEEAIIGAGAAVVREIPDRATAVGVPARVIRRREY